jgi:hypothetical protein
MNGCDKTKTDKVSEFQEQVFNKFLDYLYLDIADKSKYSTLLTGLNTQKPLNNNQYPKSILKACNMIRNHCTDDAGHINNNNHKGNENGDNNKR